MDPGKRKCIIEWVGCMTGEIISSIHQLESGSHLVKILEIISKVYDGNPEESEEKFQFVVNFLSEYYELSLTDLIDVTAIINEQDEFEIGKLCVLLMNSMLRSDNNSVIVNAVMELPNDVQFEIKNIMESLSSDLKQLSDVLTSKLELSSTSDDDSGMDLNKPMSPMHHVFTNNTQSSPIECVFPSPVGMWKVVAHQKQEDLRHVERCLLSEQHIRSELEADLDDKNRLLQAKEAKLREYQVECKQLQARIDLLHSTSETEILEFQIKELENRIQDQSKLKFQLNKMEEENQQLYKKIEQLQQQVQNVRHQCQEEQRKHHQELENQLEELQVLLLNKNQQLDVERASQKQLATEAKQANDFWKERVAQLEEQLSLQASLSTIDSGENLNIFVSDKKMGEMDDGIQLKDLVDIQEPNGKDNSFLEENNQLRLEVNNMTLKLEEMVNQHQSEVMRLRSESEEKSQVIVSKLKAEQSELNLKKELIKQQQFSIMDLNEQIRTLQREIKSSQTESNHEKELLQLQQRSLGELSNKMDNLRLEKAKLERDHSLCKHNFGHAENTITALNTDVQSLKDELISKEQLIKKQLHTYECKFSEEKEKTKKLTKEYECLQKRYNETQTLLKKFEEQSKFREMSKSLTETLQCEKSALEKQLCQTRELLQQLTFTKVEKSDSVVSKETFIETVPQKYLHSQSSVKRIDILEHEKEILTQELHNLQDLLQLNQLDTTNDNRNIEMEYNSIVSSHAEQQIQKKSEKEEGQIESENDSLKLELTKTYKMLQNVQQENNRIVCEMVNRNSELENKVVLLEKKLWESQQNFHQEQEKVSLEIKNVQHLQIQCDSLQNELSRIKEVLHEKEQNIVDAVEQQKAFQLEKEYWLRELNTKEEIIQQQHMYLCEIEKQKQLMCTENEQLYKELFENRLSLEQNVINKNEKEQILAQNIALQNQLSQMLGKLKQHEHQYCAEIEGFKNQIKILEEAILTLEIALKEKVESEVKIFEDSKLVICQNYELKLSEQAFQLDYLSQQLLQEQQNYKDRENQLQMVIDNERSNHVSFVKEHQDIIAKDSLMYKELYEHHAELQNKCKLQEERIASIQSDLNSAQQISNHYCQEIESIKNKESCETDTQTYFPLVLFDKDINRSTLCHSPVSLTDLSYQENAICETFSSAASCNKQRSRGWSQPADPECISTSRSRLDVSLQRSNSMILLGSLQTPVTSVANRQLPAGSGILFMCEDEPLGDDYNWDRIKELSQRKTGTFSSLHSLVSQESRETDNDPGSKKLTTGILVSNRKRKQEQTLSGKKTLSSSSESDSSRRKVKATGPAYQKPGPPTPGKNAQVKTNRPVRTPNSVKRLFQPLSVKSCEDSKETTKSLEKPSLSFPLKWSQNKKKSSKNIEGTVETAVSQMVAEKNKNSSRKPLRIKSTAKKESCKNL